MAHYEICVEARLDERWALWFEGMVLAATCRDGRVATMLSGPVSDQAALHGLLAKVRDLGLVLVSVQRLPYPNGEIR